MMAFWQVCSNTSQKHKKIKRKERQGQAEEQERRLYRNSGIKPTALRFQTLLYLSQEGSFFLPQPLILVFHLLSLCHY